MWSLLVSRNFDWDISQGIAMIACLDCENGSTCAEPAHLLNYADVVASRERWWK